MKKKRKKILILYRTHIPRTKYKWAWVVSVWARARINSISVLSISVSSVQIFLWGKCFNSLYKIIRMWDIVDKEWTKLFFEKSSIKLEKNQIFCISEPFRVNIALLTDYYCLIGTKLEFTERWRKLMGIYPACTWRRYAPMSMQYFDIVSKFIRCCINIINLFGNGAFCLLFVCL